MPASHTIASVTELEALYGEPVKTSLIKELDHISDHYRAFIEAAPFCVVASCGPGGLDCSPRGDPAGFVRIADSKTVMLPDRRGNNRLDTLRNLVADPRISLLFLIPGVGETMRINGPRRHSRPSPRSAASFAMQGKAPASVIVVTVDSVSTSSARRRSPARACGSPMPASTAQPCPLQARWPRPCPRNPSTARPMTPSIPSA